MTRKPKRAAVLTAASAEGENHNLVHDEKSATVSRTVSAEISSVVQSKSVGPAVYNKQVLRPLGLRSRRLESAASANAAGLVSTRPASTASALPCLRDDEDGLSDTTSNVLSLAHVTSAGQPTQGLCSSDGQQPAEKQAEELAGGRRWGLRVLEQEPADSNSARFGGCNHDAVSTTVSNAMENTGKCFCDWPQHNVLAF